MSNNVLRRDNVLTIKDYVRFVADSMSLDLNQDKLNRIAKS